MNMPAIRHAVAYGDQRSAEKGKRVRYHVTTNGTLLKDETIQFLHAHQVDVQVSIDGTPEAHDKVRIFPSGRGSHDIVTRRAERLGQLTGQCATRTTITPEEPRFSASVWHMIDALGSSNAAFEPATSSSEGQHLDSERLAIIKREWERVAEEFLRRVRGGEVPPVANLIKLLGKLHRRQKTVYGCGAGLAYLAVDPRGDVYPCHRFVGNAEWKMGNVAGEIDEATREKFLQNTVHNREPCQSCWVRYTCGGHCAHEALEATGDIARPDPVRCELQKHLTEVCLRLYVRLTRDELERILAGPSGRRVPAIGAQE